MKWIVTLVILGICALFAQSPGDIVISEIMVNPQDVSDGDGEWFEVYNHTGSPIDMEGWVISDNGGQSHTIANGGSGVVVNAASFAVFSRNANDTENGSLSGALYEYGDDIVFVNTVDALVLTSGATEIDRVEYDTNAGWPSGNGASITFTSGPGKDNNSRLNWTVSTAREGLFGGVDDDFGSPGVVGTDQILPVSLSLFTATGSDASVTIRWATVSESQNLGYEVWRSTERDGAYEELSSYRNNVDLEGQFNSSTEHNYAFEDRFVTNGVTYFYKLVDVDVNGNRDEYGPISARPTATGADLTTVGADLPGDFQLNQNYPNPFNPSTRLQFEVPSLREELAPITVEIFNALGQKVRTLYDGAVVPGVYEVEWDARSDAGNVVAAGTYIAIMKSRQVQQSIKMTLLK